MVATVVTGSFVGAWLDRSRHRRTAFLLSPVVLGVTETNDPAARFYERLGFADTGRRHPLREGSPLSVRILWREP